MAKKEDELVRRAQQTEDGWRFSFRILIKKEDDLWVAHCLELDLVANAPSEKQVQEDIVNVIVAQVRYCLIHDNMDYLFRRAPQEVWDEYNTCEQHAGPELIVRRGKAVIQGPAKRMTPKELPPFSFTTNTCWSPSGCHAV